MPLDVHQVERGAITGVQPCKPACAVQSLKLVLVDDECGGKVDERVQVARRVCRGMRHVDQERRMQAAFRPKAS